MINIRKFLNMYSHIPGQIKSVWYYRLLHYNVFTLSYYINLIKNITSCSIFDFEIPHLFGFL